MTASTASFCAGVTAVRVVVAFHLRAVVRVDRGAGAAEPGCPVPAELEGGADPVPVDAQRLPLVVGQPMATGPFPQARHVRLAGVPGASVPGRLPAQPQPAAQLRRRERAQQRRVLQPLLQQPHRRARQGQALGRGAALNVIEQDRAVAGPVQVAGAEPADPVRDDPGIAAEQQLVGDHRVRGREQRRVPLAHPPGQAVLGGVPGHPGQGRQPGDVQRAAAGQQP